MNAPLTTDDQRGASEQAAAAQCNRRVRPQPACRPYCALAMPTHPWAHLLDDDPRRASIAWRVAWTLHGLPHPLPRSEYSAMLEAVELAHGVDVVIDGLRKAASIPAAHGSGVDTRQLALIADLYAAQVSP